MNRPWYQIIWLGLGWIFLGFAGLAALLDGIANAFLLVTPVATYVGTGVIIVFWPVANRLLKGHPLRWVGKRGVEVRLKKLGLRPAFTLLGIVILLWMPRMPFFSSPTVDDVPETAANDTQTYTLIGIIREQGTPIEGLEGVVVRVLDLVDVPPETTDASGVFRFQLHTTNAYVELEGVKAGYKPLREDPMLFHPESRVTYQMRRLP